jgi:hypothetical protein
LYCFDTSAPQVKVALRGTKPCLLIQTRSRHATHKLGLTFSGKLRDWAVTDAYVHGRCSQADQNVRTTVVSRERSGELTHVYAYLLEDIVVCHLLRIWTQAAKSSVKVSVTRLIQAHPNLLWAYVLELKGHRERRKTLLLLIR